MSDLYGFMPDDLGAARLALEMALGVSFVGHNSLYRGGDYDRYESADGLVSLILQSNRDLLYREGADPPEDRWTEGEFLTMGTLLYVEAHPQPDELRTLLSRVPGMAFLKRN